MGLAICTSHTKNSKMNLSLTKSFAHQNFENGVDNLDLVKSKDKRLLVFLRTVGFGVFFFLIFFLYFRVNKCISCFLVLW